MGGDGNDQLQGARNGATLVGGAGNDVFDVLRQQRKRRGSGRRLQRHAGRRSDERLQRSPQRQRRDAGTVTQFLRASIIGGSTVLEIDTNGGANSFDELVTLQGYDGGLSGLLANAA